MGHVYPAVINDEAAALDFELYKQLNQTVSETLSKVWPDPKQHFTP